MKKNENGFSLVSVLIALGLAGGLALLIAELMNRGQKSLNTIQVGHDFIEAQGLIKDIFSNTTACKLNFGELRPPLYPNTRDGFEPNDAINLILINGIDSNSSDDDGILNSSGQVLWKVGSEIVPGLELVSMRIPSQTIDRVTRQTIVNYVSSDPGSNRGRMEVEVKLRKVGASTNTFGGTDKVFKFPIVVEVYDDIANTTTGDILNIRNCQLSGLGNGGASVFSAEEIQPAFPTSTPSGFHLEIRTNGSQDDEQTVLIDLVDPYDDARWLRFESTCKSRAENGKSTIRMTFKNSSGVIYFQEPCKANGVSNTQTAGGSYDGLIPIPSQTTQIELYGKMVDHGSALLKISLFR